MKLHLPKGLRSAVLACMAVASGFVTTVGTGFVTGGALTIAFSVPQAYADYTWQGGTGEKTADDWKNAENWGLESVAANGPGTPGSEMWEMIHLVGDGTENSLVFGKTGDVIGRIDFEGWATKFDLSDGATLYGTFKKFQGGGQTININNNSTFDALLSGNGNCGGILTVNVGEGSHFALTLNKDKGGEGIRLNLNADTATATIVGNSRSLSSTVVKTSLLDGVAADTWNTVSLGLTINGVSNIDSALSFDLGEGWERTSVEITAENYKAFGGKYYIAVDSTGAYSVIYSTGIASFEDCEWTGGSLSWGEDTTFSNSATFANGAKVAFTTANADVTLTSDVIAEQISVADGIEVSIAGDHSITTEAVSVGAGATLGISTVGNNISGVALADGSTLELSPGKEAELSSLVSAVSGSGTVVISGSGTKVTAIDHVLDSVAVVVDGAAIDTGNAYFNKDVTLQNNAVLTYTGSNSELFNWSVNQKLSVLSGSRMELGTRRISLEGTDQLILDNGTINGTGDSNSLVDICRSEIIINSKGTSAINGPIRITNNSNVRFTVEDGTLSLGLVKEGNVTKAGAGTLKMTAANTYGGSTTVEAGILEIASDSTYTLNSSKITVAEGATLKIASTDTTTLSGGTLAVAGNLQLAASVNVTGELVSGGEASYSDGADGYRTATYTYLSAGGTLEVQEGFKLLFNGEEVTGYTTSDNAVTKVFEDTSKYIINSAGYAYNADKMSSAQAIEVASDGGLVLGAENIAALGKTYLNTGASVTVKNGETALITFGGEFGQGTLSATLGAEDAPNTFNTAGVAQNYSGSVTIESGKWTVSNQQRYTGGTTINEGATLTITGGGGSGGTIRGTANVLGGTLELAIGDATGYDANDNSLRVINLGSAEKAGGTLLVSTLGGSGQNQTLGGATINMYGGTITSPESAPNSSMDMFRGSSAINVYSVGGTAEAPTESTISIGKLGLRQNDSQFFVDEGARLTVTSTFVNGDSGNHKLVKSGAGELVIAGMYEANGDMIINAGTLTVKNGAYLSNGTKYVADGATLRAEAGATVRSTVQVSGGGTFEFGTTGCGFGGITLKLLDGANLAFTLGENINAGNTVKVMTFDAGVNSVFVDTGDIELVAGQTYTLLNVSSGFNDIDISKFALKNEVDAELYDTVFAVDGNSLTLSLIQKEVDDGGDTPIVDDGTRIWTGSTEDNVWNSEAENTPWLLGESTAIGFEAGNKVYFNTTAAADERTVNISGEVSAAEATVIGEGWAWQGEGSVATTGKLILGDATEATSLTISSTGSKNFAGGVELNESATLVVKDTTNWSGVVRGAGTLEIATGLTYNTTGNTKPGFMNVLGSEPRADVVGTIRLSNGTGITLNSSGANTWEWLRAADTLEIVDGANVQMASSQYNYWNAACASNIRIAGAGLSTAEAGTAAAAALAFTNALQGGFNSTLELLGDATIYVGEGVAAAFASWTPSAEYVLTKTGAGILGLGVGETVSLDKIDLQSGGLALRSGGSTVVTGEVELTDGLSLLFFSSNAPNEGKMVVESLDVSGTVTVGMQQNSACHNATVAINKLTGTQGSTLKLISGAQTAEASVLELAGNGADVAAADAFSGTIQLYGNVYNNNNRYVTMVITDGTMTANSVIDVAENAAGRHKLGIGVNDSTVTVAGLTSSIENGANLTIYSGAAACGSQAFASDDVVRTLAINTAAETAYTTNATVLGSLNITKSGAGSQAFTGNMSGFNGDITVEGGTLTIDGAAEDAAAIAAGKVDVQAGANAVFAEGVQVSDTLTSAGNITTTAITGEGSVAITGGTLHLTGAEGIADSITTTISGGTLKAEDNSWAINGGSVGGVAIVTGDGTITLNGSTLTSTIDNSQGKLALSGDIKIDAEGYVTAVDSIEYSSTTGNGYARSNAVYTIATSGANLTTSDVSSWLVGDTEVSTDNYVDGKLTVTGNWGTEYFLNGVVEEYANISKINGAGDALTAVVLAGSGLNLNSDLGSVMIKAAKEGESVVDIASHVTLNATSVSSDAEHKVKLHGYGTYVLADTVTTLGDGVVLGADWFGTVKMNAVTLSNADYSAFAATKLVVSNSTISEKLVVQEGGSLTLSGDITVGVSGVAEPDSYTHNGVACATGNGFYTTTTNYTLAEGTSTADGVTWIVDGAAAEGTSYANGVLTVTGIDTTTYWVREGEVTYNGSTAACADAEQTLGGATISINGGTLKLATSDVAAGYIGSGATGGTLNVNGQNITQSVFGTLEGAVALTGTGSYALGEGVTALVDNVSLGSGWIGTVKTGDITATGALDISSLGNSSSTVQAGAVSAGSLTGAAVNLTADSVSLSNGLTTLGSLTTTGALTLSESATISADRLSIGGGVTVNNLVAGLIATGTVDGALTLNIAEALLDSTIGVTQDKTLALLTLTGEFADDAALQAVKDSILLGAFTDEGVAGTTQAGALYDYELAWEGQTLLIKGIISSKGYIWEGDTDYNWESSGNWKGNSVPTAESAVFLTGAVRTNVLISSEAEAGSLTVEDWTESRQDLNIGGTGSLAVTNDINVVNGKLQLMVDTTVGGNVNVNGTSVLGVHSFDGVGKTVQVTGDLNNAHEVHVWEGATLDVTGAIMNDGTLMTQVGSVVAGSLINNGTVDAMSGSVTVAGALTNNDELKLTDGSLSAGSLINDGALTAEGSTVIVTDALVNNGTAGVTGGSLTAGSLNNGGQMTVNGAASVVTGALANSDTLNVTGGSLSAGSMVNSGTLAVDDATVTVGSETEAGDLINVGGTITLGSETAGAGLVVNGNVDNSEGGSISLTDGSSLTVSGDLNNAGGTLSIAGKEASVNIGGAVDNTGGTLSLTGEGATANIGGNLTLTDGTSKGTLTVGAGTDLTVGGDLAADDVTLAFGGNVTVGGNVEIDTLTNDGTFTANGSGETEVHINTLTNNGTVSVGVMKDGVLTGGHLDITTLIGDGALNVGEGGSLTINSFEGEGDVTVNDGGSLVVDTFDGDGALTVGDGGSLTITTFEGDGSGDVTVGKDGSLTIEDEVTFSGQLNNQGTLIVDTTTLDSAQLDKAQTAGGIITASLTVTENAIGHEDNGGSYMLGDVATDKLVVDALTSGSPRLSMSSLDTKDDTKVTLVLSEVESGEITDGTYHVIALENAMDGSLSEKLDLSAYGYNAEGVYDGSMAEVQAKFMQDLLRENKYVVFTEANPARRAMLRGIGASDVYMSITDVADELSVWMLDGEHSMTEAGLTVLKGDGSLLDDDILDKVQHVWVTDTQSIDLAGDDLTSVTLNGLAAVDKDKEVKQKLTISGDSSELDEAIITTDADGYKGTLVLTKVNATVNGVVDTLVAGEDTSATLGLTGTDIELGAEGVTLSGKLTGGSLNFDVQSDELGATIMSGDLALEGSDINVTQSDENIVIADVGTGKTALANLDATSGSADVTLMGAGLNKYFTNARLEDGAVVADRNTTYVTDKLNPTTANGAAGAKLLDSVLVEINPQAAAEATPTLAELMNLVDAGAVTDTDAAAIAGSSVATVGMALSGDVDRQLRTIRNRTTTMGVSECVVNEGMPYFNAWVQAEGNRSELDRDGSQAGYVLDSWGGTVGFDVDLNDNLTMGLAITAMYGDLQADAPDMGEGDMDTYYVSLFARYAESAWTHTFVATVGTMEGTFNRTVNVGNGYKTEADTEGMSFGLMYEVGYVMPLDEDATACLQPIFNVTLRHSSVDGYTEEGSDAALDVGSQDMTTLTFGLGARMQAVVGESVYNRASIFEARAMAKLDVGDRSSEADVAFAAGGATSKVESAELGAFGVELGAGLTIPVGDDDGSIFVDGSVELRSGYTNYNGTVGYRINF